MPEDKCLRVAPALAITADIEEGKRNLDELGYTVHRGFLSPDEVAGLRDRLVEQAELEREAGVALVSSTGHAGSDRRHDGGADGGLPTYQQISFLPNKGAVFRAAMHHPVALAYADHAFRSAPFNVVTQTGSILRRGAQRQVLHADQQAWPFATPMPVMLNVLVALSDFDEDMGATNVVPASHHHSSPDMALDAPAAARKIGGELIPMTCRAGDAMIFESRTWHCQGTAVSPKTRLAIATVYGLHCVKPQDDYPALIHDAVYDELSEADRELLGFTVHHEYSGRIGPRHPADRRCNTNMRFPYVPELTRSGTARAVAYGDLSTASGPASVARPASSTTGDHHA